MRLDWKDIRKNAVRFSRRWKDGKDERQQAQLFLNDFLGIFGVDPKRVATFERKVPRQSGRLGYIDLLWKGLILIEMKSFGKNLDKAYEQAKDYAFRLENDADLPKYTLVCDFQRFRLYNNQSPERGYEEFPLAELSEKIHLFSELASYEPLRDKASDRKIDQKAAEMMAELHDLFKATGYEGHPLEVYLVRLLFCLFADDTGIFPKNLFYEYVGRSGSQNLSSRLEDLFVLLNASPEERDQKPYIVTDELRDFPYVNGDLFKEVLPRPRFDNAMQKILFDCADLDWTDISPAIFGSMFQGVMDEEIRRNLGAHYTSEENILRVIDPLFLDGLWEEFNQLKFGGTLGKLKAFHEKLSGLKFLDPACGCGNFLIVAYRELRLLELEVLKAIYRTDDETVQGALNIEFLCKVNVDQFYGIEIEEFPAQIAQVGLWLIDHQMNNKVSLEFGKSFMRIPLTTSATIIHGNALTLDWETIVPRKKLSYILGNPPFSGARIMSSFPKSELCAIFSDTGKAGNLDYVTAWYKKAVQYIQTTDIAVAFVSTNSISQGEQAALLWEPLMDGYKVKIDFAWHTFKWSNEGKGKAAVHCVIIGFSREGVKRDKLLIEETNGKIRKTPVDNINPYLVDAPTVFIEGRTNPLCDVPEMRVGNLPIDGGNYLFTNEEKKAFLQIEPEARKWFRPWMGSHEFINRYSRYCLWLGHCPPEELHKLPECMKRIEAVRMFRLKSKRIATRKLALTPRRFHVENMPKGDYFVIPKVSSERRDYIPIGFLSESTLASDLLFIIPNATLYHFGVLTSRVHNAWMRSVCGRLKSDYRYSSTIVYNNFPWPEVTDKKKEKIEKCALAVLGVRELFPDSSLADLYDPLTMPPELLKAHQNLDQAVMQAYGYSKTMTESNIVANLMRRYQKLVEEQSTTSKKS